ncbi:hypothetical protein E0L36_17440 [Streptomyces sp. AJS327]|uniref:Clp protease N-terminal domain-containing protein n=1 Tax=Streptomyces sp. AJS327 TaxID=2545265 RepID=UPI0015DEEF61|nr:Clp protease N-terminal domain-containing protein [Streptomyces sp. AJS327]MBA0052605.1 hypothetical protein [Streptomyces sp. AJS327]
MTAIATPDWKANGALGAARGARTEPGDPIGSWHLLAGITTTRGPAREALAAEGATRTVVAAVVRDRKNRQEAWGGDDDAENSVDSRKILGDDGDEGLNYTGAAVRALTSAMEVARRDAATKFGTGHLLRGLLAEDNRAVELLATCGIAPDAVLARLDGETAPRPDDLDPLLHPTRDILLGRDHYRRMVFWKRWLLSRGGVNWASRPAWWVSLETHEQARRLGDGEVGTEHVLLAILATHEVASRYPHLAGERAPDPGPRYAGGERLAGLGLGYVAVHAALTGGDRPRMTPDPRPVEGYLDEATSRNAAPAESGSACATTVDPGTGPLVEALLGEETRARQLVEALGATLGD